MVKNDKGSGKEERLFQGGLEAFGTSKNWHHFPKLGVFEGQRIRERRSREAQTRRSLPWVFLGARQGGEKALRPQWMWWRCQ